jgi:short-subunit dehydrogenase
MSIALTAEPGRRLAAVTGASRGLGLELAKVFAQNNFDLVIAADSTAIRQVVPALEDLGAQVQAVQTDLATAAGVDRFYECLVEQGRDIDAVAMNAGAGVGGEFIDTAIEEELRLVNLNIISLLRLTKKILPDFVKLGSGRILYTSLLTAQLPGPFYAVYEASKAFLQSFAEAIRVEVEDTGVTITALHASSAEPSLFARGPLAAQLGAGAASPEEQAQLAREGFEALMAGRDHVLARAFKRPGTVARLLPEPLGASLQERPRRRSRSSKKEGGTP